MAQIKKQEDITTNDNWERLKAQAIEVSMLTLHQPAPLFNRTEKTISPAKFPGIKLWRAPNVYLCEMDGKRKFLEAPAVIGSDPV